MSTNVNITSGGIRKLLGKYTPEQAVAEYIWNGFDAGATSVELNFNRGPLGKLDFLQIQDNGYGINFNQLEKKFFPFYESEKAIEISAPVHTSLMHGKNGVGRLTFFTFAHLAEWETTYQGENTLESGKIFIDQSTLKSYQPEKSLVAFSETTGTKVTFKNVQLSVSDMLITIIPFLVSEFCWFLELNQARNYKILVNNVPLDYATNVVDRDDAIEIIYEKNNTLFTGKFIQWKLPLHKELSKYYFLNSDGVEVYKDFTTLNKKGDEFFHSVYIQSNFFDNFNAGIEVADNQSLLFGKAKSSPEYKFLIRTINEYVRAKRKPYLRIFAAKLVEKYEQDGILPHYATEWEEKYKKPQLEETLIGLYEAEPKLFTNLNVDQKKTFVRFLDLILDSNERENIFPILDEIIDLEPEEREDLAKLFHTTKLNRVIETIKLIEDRYKTFYQLRDLVFDPSLKANEVDHLQKVIENHYWIFGEQYHLVTAAEPKFEEALRRYIYLLTEKDSTIEIEHQHRLKEMDIFACRQNMLSDRIENIVLELKHPAVALGLEQYTQIDQYLQVILSRPEFNASNMNWEFYLVGNKFNTSGFIERQIATNKNHGQAGLVLSLDDGRVKVFIKKWSEVFADFEIRHKHLDTKLKLERDHLVNDLKTAVEVVVNIKENTAVQQEQITVPTTINKHPH
jgi:hypothetical protein